MVADVDVVIVSVSTPVEVGLRYQLPILGLPCPDYAIRRAGYLEEVFWCRVVSSSFVSYGTTQRVLVRCWATECDGW